MTAVLYIGEQEVKINPFLCAEAFNSDVVDAVAYARSYNKVESLKIQGEFKLVDVNIKVFKRLFKLPRKKKKMIFGTRRQRKKASFWTQYKGICEK